MTQQFYFTAQVQSAATADHGGTRPLSIYSLLNDEAHFSVSVVLFPSERLGGPGWKLSLKLIRSVVFPKNRQQVVVFVSNTNKATLSESFALSFLQTRL